METIRRDLVQLEEEGFVRRTDGGALLNNAGGVVRKGEGTMSGYWAEDMIEQFWVDKLFLGVGCVDMAQGIMDFHIEETNLRR